MLTGEVGTETTVAKAMLHHHSIIRLKLALYTQLRFQYSLLEAICDEFEEVEYPEQASLKQLSQAIHYFFVG
ncbi:hypothetical protein O9929_02210 [Vibrio lentus]|nr:hypothetical protein [Vibrio lentus]